MELPLCLWISSRRINWSWQCRTPPAPIVTAVKCLCHAVTIARNIFVPIATMRTRSVCFPREFILPAPYIFILEKQQDLWYLNFSELAINLKFNSVFARSPLSLPQSLFSRSLRSTICNPGHPHPMRTPRITNGGPERAKKHFGGERREIVQTPNTFWTDGT